MRPFPGRVIFAYPLIPLALLLALATAGCGSRELPKIGEQAKSEQQIGITVNDVKFYDEYTLPVVLGSVQKPEGENNLFVFANVTVENLGGEAREVNSFRLFDASGKEYAPPIIIKPLPETQKLDIGETLGAGQKAEGMVVYIIAKDTVLDRITYMSQPPVEISLDSLTATTPPPAPLPKIGETASGGGVEMIVHSIDTPSVLTSGYFSTTPAPGSKIVVIDVTLKNVSIQPVHTVNPLDFYLLGENNKLTMGGELALGMALEEKLKLTDLPPGSAVRGKIVYTMPAATPVKGVYYNIEVLGPPVQVDVT